MDTEIANLNDEFVQLLFEANPSLCFPFGIRAFEDRIFDCSLEFHVKFVGNVRQLRDRVIKLKETAMNDFTSKQQDDVAFLLDAIDQALVTEGVPGESGYRLELSNNHFEGELVGLEAHFEFSPLESVADLQNYRKKLSLIPVQCKHMIDNYRRGIKRNATLNKVGVELIINVCKTLYGHGKIPVTAARESGLNRAQICKRLVQDEDFLVPVLVDQVFPALQLVTRFLETEYIQYARKADGISDIPGAYERYIQINTGIAYSAKEIHSLGLAEVSRITALLENAKKACGFVGSLKEFQSNLLDRSKYPHLYMDEDKIIPACEEIISNSKARMVSMFDHFPKFNCQVKPVPKNLEETSPLGSYNNPSSTEGGAFQINMRLQKEKPSHQLKALCLHEGNPGHHHSISLVSENKSQHLIRRIVMSGAYTEGWGLYSEFLGEELGIYTDPFEYFGRLEMEMWRACRLVVDSGLHSKGWTIDESVEYMMERIAMTRDEVVTEVRRYTAIPGQALNYKIGELKIKELRAFAKRELGDQFNLMQFHEVVLGSGALPLVMLDRLVKEWVRASNLAQSSMEKVHRMDILLPSDSFGLVGRTLPPRYGKEHCFTALFKYAALWLACLVLMKMFF
ncbi:hypothetical protein BDR26DRAFT_871884, partial [Obelidium mucronatum]